MPGLDVLFVCLHGSAKSVIAAAYCRRLAADRGLDVVVASAGVEPYDEVPSYVLEGLAADGIALADDTAPRQLTDAIVSEAQLVVVVGCEISSRAKQTIRWDDVPDVSDGYAAARDAIVAKVTALVDRFA